MIKIENALRQASAVQYPTHRQTPVAPPAGGGGALAAVHQPAPLSEVEAHACSRKTIARMRESRLLDRNTLARHQIIHAELTQDHAVEAFRELRTRILQKTHGHNGTLMITGVTPGSGSTFVALNLSAAFAFDTGKTALFMDCNLRDPFAQRLCQRTDIAGLTDYLDNADLPLSSIIYPVGIERLRVIPAGGRREILTEYFASPRMKQLLEEVRQRYPERFVVVDSPPVSDSADTLILAELCDYVLLVVPYGKVTSQQIGNCTRAIDSKKLLGVIFNDEPLLPVLPWKRILMWPFGELWRGQAAAPNAPRW